MRSILALGLTAASAAALVGCGEGSGTKRGVVVALDDNQKVTALVTEFADTGSHLTMVKYFVDGTKIGQAEYKKYIAYNYKVDGKPAIAGDSATAMVKVTSAKNEREVGAKEWQFVKQGDRWKLKSAPLP
jgi:hypothetical protein